MLNDNVYIVVLTVFQWGQILLKQSDHGISGLPNSNPLHCKEKQRNTKIRISIHCERAQFLQYSQLSPWEHSTITDTHYYKQELHPQPQTTKKCMKTTPAISDSRYDRIADASGGPK